MRRAIAFLPLLAALASPALAFEMDVPAGDALRQMLSGSVTTLGGLEAGKPGGFDYAERQDFCSDSGTLKVRAGLHVWSPPSGNRWSIVPSGSESARLRFNGPMDLKNLESWVDQWGLPLIASPCEKSAFGPDWLDVESLSSESNDETPFFSTSEILGIDGNGTVSDTGFALDVDPLQVRQALRMTFTAQLKFEPADTWTTYGLGLPELCMDEAGQIRANVGVPYHSLGDYTDPDALEISISAGEIVSLRIAPGDWQEHRFLRSVFGAVDIPCSRSPRDPEYLWVVGSINGKIRLSELLE